MMTKYQFVSSISLDAVLIIACLIIVYFVLYLLIIVCHVCWCLLSVCAFVV
jgi:hypothetical protein